MPQEYRPLAVFFGALNASGELVFNTIQSEVVLSTYVQETISLLRECSGFRTISEVRATLMDIDEDVFNELVQICKDNQLIIDSRELYQLNHRASVNPQLFSTDLSSQEIQKLARSSNARSFEGSRHALDVSAPSKLYSLLAARTTTRELVNAPLPSEVFSGLFTSIVGMPEFRSTPSAGGLYSLDLYAVVNTGQCIPQGVYYYHPERYDLVMISNTQVEQRCFEALNHEEGVEYSVTFFLAANLKRVGAKYSNRAYRYALIEVGHAAQNAALYCAEQQLGILEYGGFHDEYTSKLLRLSSTRVPMLALIIGGKLSPDDHSVSAQFTRLKKSVLNKSQSEQSLRIGLTRSQNLVRWAAQSSYRTHPAPHDSQVAFGSAETMAESGIKALAEGYERYASGVFRIDAKQSASKLLHPWLDPSTIAPIDDWQSQYYPDLGLFDPKQTIEWVQGIRHLSTEKILVPVDLVFYPFPFKELGRAPFYKANSSGVAAGANFFSAQKNALLELVERDALMVTWLTRRKVTAFPSESIPEELGDRIKHWQNRGRNVKFVNLQLDGPPVVLVVIYSSRKYPALTTGCSSALTFAEACRKAFQEAESGLLHALSDAPVPYIKDPRQVSKVAEHQEFYFHTGNSSRLTELAWILDASELFPDDFDRRFDYAEVIGRFDPIFLDLTPQDGPLKVVRALSEKLVPINFGFRTEHVAHLRFEMLNLKEQVVRPRFPHFFA